MDHAWLALKALAIYGRGIMGKEEGAKKITVIGVVQGVGFRPFVYKIASSLGLKGYVKNLGGEVMLIEKGGARKGTWLSKAV